MNNQGALTCKKLNGLLVFHGTTQYGLQHSWGISLTRGGKTKVGVKNRDTKGSCYPHSQNYDLLLNS